MRNEFLYHKYLLLVLSIFDLCLDCHTLLIKTLVVTVCLQKEDIT